MAASDPMFPIVLSAASASELVALADRVGAEREDRASLVARADPWHPYRVVAPGRSPDERAGLPALVAAARRRPAPGRLAFLYSGQSSQRPGMGLGLAARFPAVAATLDEVVGADLLGRDDGSLDRAEHAQPALLAFALAVTDLLGAVGVRPDVVAGHSFGEITAAAATGVWTRTAATGLALTRGRLIDGLTAGGGMVAIEAGEAEVTAALPGPDVELSAVHSPTSVVVAGPLDAVRAVAADFAARGVRTREFGMTVAAHSPAMEPMLGPLADAVAAARGRPGTVPVVGNATGRPVDPAALPTPAHWTAHCRETVRWADVMAWLIAADTAEFLEIGPSGVLGRLAAACLPTERGDDVVPVVEPEPDEVTTFLEALARLDARGHPVDWAAVHAAGRW